MTTWLEAPLLGFDTETTGVDTGTERILSAALVRSTPTGTQSATWLINPGVQIPEQARAIHGISDEDVQKRGADPVTALGEIAETISASLRRGIPLVAFNATFDLTILNSELRRHSMPTLEERIDGPVIPVLDPLVIDRGVEPRRRGKRTLEALCKLYETPCESLHNAESDAIATLQLLATIGNKHALIGTMSALGLHEWQRLAYRRWAMGFNQWRAREGLGPSIDDEWLVPPETSSKHPGNA